MTTYFLRGTLLLTRARRAMVKCSAPHMGWGAILDADNVADLNSTGRSERGSPVRQTYLHIVTTTCETIRSNDLGLYV